MKNVWLSILCSVLCVLTIACDDSSNQEESSGGVNAGTEVNVGGSSGGDAGAEAGEEAGEEPDEPVFGEIEATVTYSGDLGGQLVIGVFPEVPPVSPPVSFKIINEPVFPQTVTLDFVEEGDWYVFAFVDAEPINSQSPSETDPQGNSEVVTVVGEMVNTVSFELVVP